MSSMDDFLKSANAELKSLGSNDKFKLDNNGRVMNLSNYASLCKDIKKLLISKKVKMPVSDIDAHLKNQDVKTIKIICEELYHNGEINRTGNYRYFILNENEAETRNILSPKVKKVNIKEELTKYKDLLDEGLIEQTDYDAKKKELLGL